MLDYYTPGQQKVERGFRFLKDPWFMANTLFLKSPKRIMALVMIMTLCLLIYGALEYLSCKHSNSTNKCFPPNLEPLSQSLLHAGCFNFLRVSMCC
jgi:transposase